MRTSFYRESHCPNTKLSTATGTALGGCDTAQGLLNSCSTLAGVRGSSYRESLAAQPVDATPFNRLIQQYFPQKTNLYGSTQSEPKQGSVSFESTPANEFSFVDFYK